MNEHNLITLDQISRTIYRVRGAKIMLDRDLAQLYQVKTKALKQAVRRNVERFPDDFMFELTKDEFENLRSQIVTSSWGGTRYAPMAFTEQGVAMLSSILRSDRAIQVNIQIMRTFTKLRHELLETHELKAAIDDLRRETETRLEQSDERFEIVFNVLDKLLADEDQPKRKIGFIEPEKN